MQQGRNDTIVGFSTAFCTCFSTSKTNDISRLKEKDNVILCEADHGHSNGVCSLKMSANTPSRPAAPSCNGILREQSPNLPETATTTRRTTPSTLSNSSTSNGRHVQFDQDVHGRIERTSLLALAYMPPTGSDDEDEAGSRPRNLSTIDEELEHDLNDLADYQGDSDDEGSVAEEVLQNIATLEREHDTAVICDDSCTPCEKFDTREQQQQQQQATENAPLLMSGAPVGWKQPGAPKKWKEPKPKLNLGQPNVKFNKIDNPGGWSAFTFRPKFKYKGRTPAEFLNYSMPTDATPVPKKKGDGKRTSNGWDFCYTGWTRENTDAPFRSGATRDNLHPECRKGSIDGNLLKKLGLTKDRMSEADGAPDSLFFYQLLLPIHDTRNGGSGIENDPRKPFYPHVGECAEVHAITDVKVRGSGRGHRFKETLPQELVQCLE